MASDLPPLPDEIWADPGRRDWYFREKKPDSVARYVRDTRIASLEVELAEAKAENARLLAQVRAMPIIVRSVADFPDDPTRPDKAMTSMRISYGMLRKLKALR